MSNSKYEISEKYWVVSEVKASLIEVYNNFLKAQENYIRSLKKILDPTQSKAEYISALYGLYTMFLNGFPEYIENKKDINYTEEDYISLALSDEHDDDKLVRMGYILQKWASTEGAFRITHQERSYNDPIDMLLDENEMS